MSIYKLKTCREEDKDQLIDFIREYWQEDHAFVKSDELLNFQHYDKGTKEYSFILGFNTISKEIDGVIGLIPLSHFDHKLKKYNETWGGIWKVREDVKNEEIGLLGIQLFEAFKKYTSHGSIGMSKIAVRLHRIMRYKICELNQYYLLNTEINEFKIGFIPDDYMFSKEIDESNYTIRRIINIKNVPEESVTCNYKPTKSITYLFNRFQNHPIYKYLFWGIYENTSKLHTIIVTRSIEVNNSKIIRIVDVFGVLEELNSIKSCLITLMKNEEAEYIDIMNFGLPPEVFTKLGFEKLSLNGEIIIPHYFEPFIQKNILIKAAYKSPYDYIMFKADSDQDRPNLIDLK
jgi:hypothetical protein